MDELPDRSELTLVLVVASVTPTLRNELERLNAKLVKLDGGYARIEGLGYTCFVAIIDEVCEAERDEYLRLFSHHKEMTEKAAQWIKQRMKESKMKEPSVEEIQEADEWFQQIMARMPIEKRLAGLDEGELVAALPVHVLSRLSADYIDSLAPHIFEKIHRRLHEQSH